MSGFPYFYVSDSTIYAQHFCNIVNSVFSNHKMSSCENHALKNIEYATNGSRVGRVSDKSVLSVPGARRAFRVY